MRNINRRILNKTKKLKMIKTCLTNQTYVSRNERYKKWYKPRKNQEQKWIMTKSCYYENDIVFSAIAALIEHGKFLSASVCCQKTQKKWRDRICDKCINSTILKISEDKVETRHDHYKTLETTLKEIPWLVSFFV